MPQGFEPRKDGSQLCEIAGTRAAMPVFILVAVALGGSMSPALPTKTNVTDKRNPRGFRCLKGTN
jgi:hypothetical protein